MCNALISRGSDPHREEYTLINFTTLKRTSFISSSNREP